MPGEVVSYSIRNLTSRLVMCFLLVYARIIVSDLYSAYINLQYFFAAFFFSHIIIYFTFCVNTFKIEVCKLAILTTFKSLNRQFIAWICSSRAV